MSAVATPGVAFAKGLVRDRRAALGFALVLIAVLAAIAAPLIAPFDPDIPDFGAALAPPSAMHLLGTDDLGRDVLSRVIFGARISLFVGFFSVAGALVLGTGLGLVAGYFGGLADS